MKQNNNSDAAVIEYLDVYGDAADGLDPVGLADPVAPPAKIHRRQAIKTMPRLIHMLIAAVAMALGGPMAWAQDGEQALPVGAQHWSSTLTLEQRARVQDRFRKWNGLNPDQRAKLRERFEQFQKLPLEQQQKIRQAFRRFGSLPPTQRRQLREQFERMNLQEHQAFLAGAAAQNRAGMVREFFQSIPVQERKSTRQSCNRLLRSSAVHSTRPGAACRPISATRIVSGCCTCRRNSVAPSWRRRRRNPHTELYC